MNSLSQFFIHAYVFFYVGNFHFPFSLFQFVSVCCPHFAVHRIAFDYLLVMLFTVLFFLSSFRHYVVLFFPSSSLSRFLNFHISSYYEIIFAFSHPINTATFLFNMLLLPPSLRRFVFLTLCFYSVGG